MSKKYNDLTKQEEDIIIHKGTERPFSGKYYVHKDKGTYICKRCNAPLFLSDDKFSSDCGWPSFDNEVQGALKRIPDADGERVEITCKNCGAHLGHVFTGEGFTKRDTRYCVNSISLNFKLDTKDVRTRKAYFAGGCFWGVEYYFQDHRGVISTRVGYMGGHAKQPAYEEVSGGKTSHAEALEVVFDNSKTTYEELARLFFGIHDPTQVDRQGPDVGSQYRSVVFYKNDEQKKTIEKLIKTLEDKGYKIATRLEKAGTFWEAEGYHQKYYQKSGHTPYCHIPTKRF